MALTSDQLTDFHRDIGDDGSVFTDDELNRLYTRAEDDYDMAVVLALRQILANAVKLHDYQIAQSMEKASQVFDHIKSLLQYRETVTTGATQQVAIVGMQAVPPRAKQEPLS